MRIAINGFGRIGRCVARALFEENYDNLELVAINASAPIESQINLLKYDSIHGRFNHKVNYIDNNTLTIDKKEILLLNQRDPSNLPWGDLGVDIVLECTGSFTTKEGANKHIESGAKKVIISAPSKSKDVKTVVYGVNENIVEKNDDIISVGSCTTNCLAPVAKILNNKVGIEKGLMTTIHSYTNDQNIVDNFHKDFRRGRAGTLSMIPTSTGAARAIDAVIPELKGKLDGRAIRVPTPNVSLIDFDFVSKRNISADEVNFIVENEVKSSEILKSIIQIVKDPVVSIDFNHSTYSCCFDVSQTKSIENLVKISAFYDNEWGFSIRMIDIALLLSSKK